MPKILNMPELAPMQAFGTGHFYPILRWDAFLRIRIIGSKGQWPSVS